MFNTPVLFLVFNRPELTKKVFEQIRKIQPAFLYIAADGPRTNKPREDKICAEVKNIILSNIDWDCEVKTLFREQNLGCGKAVSQAITWFFEHVEEGIILEDDCLPDLSFFSFCTELLEKYRNDQRVMSISGSNLLDSSWKADEHSYFWGWGGIWGWATWKRAWNLYDIKILKWESSEIKNLIKDELRLKGWVDFYYPMFEAVFNGKLDTWDIQWFFTILINGGLAINPSANLVKNIGFGVEATHTSDVDNKIAKLSMNCISFPLKHPLHFIRDVDYLKQMLISINPKQDVNSNLSRTLFELKNIIKAFK